MTIQKKTLNQLLATALVFAACDDLSEESDDPLPGGLPGSAAPPTYSGPPAEDLSPPAEAAPGSCPATMQTLPTIPFLIHLTGDDTHLFATSSDPRESETVLYRIDVANGEREKIARIPGTPRDLLLDGDNLFVSTNPPGASAELVDVYRVSRSGDKVKKMVTSEPDHGLAADDRDLYFFRGPRGGADKLVRRSLADGEETLVRRRPAAPFVVDADAIWVAGPERHVVFARIDKETGDETILARWEDVRGLEPAGPRAIFQDETHVYSAGPYDGFVVRLNKATGAVSVVRRLFAPTSAEFDRGESQFDFGAADGGFLYHFETRLLGEPPYRTEVNRVSLATGKVESITTSRSDLAGLTTADGCVLFGDLGHDGDDANRTRIRAFQMPGRTAVLGLAN
jgi:hypothetical protein